MRIRFSFASAMLLTAAFVSGCNIVDSTQKLFDSRPPGYVDGTEFVDEKWTSTAGKQGRGNRARQTDPDRLWGVMQSPKSRDIERNLGYDHPIDQ